MQKVIKVDEKIVKDIQQKNVEAQITEETIMEMINAHQMDTDGSFVESPIFKAYKADAVKNRIAFEEAKNQMYNKFVPEDIKAKGKTWELNYFTGELTVNM